MRTLASVAAGLAIFAAPYCHKNPKVPRCAEDVVILGVGDFNKGRWTKYVCGPARDSYTK